MLISPSLIVIPILCRIYSLLGKSGQEMMDLVVEYLDPYVA